MTKIKYPNYIIYDIFIKKLKALNVIVHVVYSCQENSIFIYLFTNKPKTQFSKNNAVIKT